MVSSDKTVNTEREFKTINKLRSHHKSSIKQFQMKKWAILILSMFLLSLTSCSKWYDRLIKLTNVNYTVTDAKNIELFYTDYVERKYEPIGFVIVNLPNGGLIAKDQTPRIQRLKELAAENGADAVMKIEIVVTDEGYVFRGLAVKWK
jgi:hypothetical protein